jgi:GTP:adenosylcobinamide-phosphate guanylyltransferase
VKAIIMAGGKASRLGGVEKGLIKVCGEALAERLLKVINIVSNDILVVVSKNSKALVSFLRNLGPDSIDIIEGTGKDYVYDLSRALELIDNFPVIVAPIDMPFLSLRILKKLINFSMSNPEAIINVSISKECKYYRRKGLTGLSLFLTYRGSWKNLDLCVYPDLLDIDTLEDLEEARTICSKEYMGE